jgi:hypothetical protein
MDTKSYVKAQQPINSRSLPFCQIDCKVRSICLSAHYVPVYLVARSLPGCREKGAAENPAIIQASAIYSVLTIAYTVAFVFPVRRACLIETNS